ncbi:HNH endonuclease [Paracoccus yeei]|uniref:HNH endonuclease n=2 Tax=Paracoccus yeei TaxID=147645 RepID=A0A1V0GY55_9RHOB|nr:HNH endonuclease [Paracoccus yeei]
MFSSEAVASAWNVQFAGKPALIINRSDGYLSGSIFDKRFLAHRVVWAMKYGEWPKDQIDHINGNRSDNRISNLRDVPNIENGKNLGLPSNNTSGVRGVYFSTLRKKWVVQIGSHEKRKTIGSFHDFEDAVAARRKAEKQFGYHSNHGSVRERFPKTTQSASAQQGDW